MARVFITHVGEDEPLTAQAARGLEQAGHSVWLMGWSESTASAWSEASEAALTQCDAAVLVISAKATASLSYAKEALAIRGIGKPFVPLLVDLSLEEAQARRPAWRAALADQTPLWGSRAALEQLASDLPERMRVLGLPSGGATFERPRNTEPTSPTAPPFLPSSPAPALAHSAPIAPAPIITPQAPAEAASVRSANGSAMRSLEPGRLRMGAFDVRLDVVFDQQTYLQMEEPTARFLVEVELQSAFDPPVNDVVADIVLVVDVSASMQHEGRFGVLRTAIRELATQLDATDRVAIIAYAERAELISEFQTGDEVRESLDDILHALDHTPALFGRRPHLAEALTLAAQLVAPPSCRPDAVRRVYIVSDGQVYDPVECRGPLGEMRQLRAELGVYVLGTRVNIPALRRLVAGQSGSWVKPIVEIAQLVETFRHVAEVNRRLVAREGRIVVDFKEEIGLGHAWAFRPHEISFGPMTKRRMVCSLGAVEAQRTYALAFEVQLPITSISPTLVADVSFVWQRGVQVNQCRGTVFAGRSPVDGWQINDRTLRVLRAFTVLAAIRDVTAVRQKMEAERARLDEARANRLAEPRLAAIQRNLTRLLSDEHQLLYEAESARLALALAERRDPELIAALERKIALLDYQRSPAAKVAPSGDRSVYGDRALRPEEILLTESNWDSHFDLGSQLADPSQAPEHNRLIEPDDAGLTK